MDPIMAFGFDLEHCLIFSHYTTILGLLGKSRKAMKTISLSAFFSIIVCVCISMYYVMKYSTAHHC